eukprot:6467175-Amphidinium_carterae.1
MSRLCCLPVHCQYQGSRGRTTHDKTALYSFTDMAQVPLTAQVALNLRPYALLELWGMWLRRIHEVTNVQALPTNQEGSMLLKRQKSLLCVPVSTSTSYHSSLLYTTSENIPYQGLPHLAHQYTSDKVFVLVSRWLALSRCETGKEHLDKETMKEEKDEPRKTRDQGHEQCNS